MKVGISSWALGLTIAFTLGNVSVASAQATRMDTTRRVTDSTHMMDSTRMRDSTHARRHRAHRTAVSSQRIPVTKESKGEVVDTTTPPPVRTDTAVTPPPTRPETTAVSPPPPTPPETTTVTRSDTTAVAPTPAPPPPRMHRAGGFYWGFGGGASLPSQNLRNGYGTGYNVTVPLGWDPAGSPLGLRVDVGYDREMGRGSVGVNNDVGIWSGNLDAKLRAPTGMLSHFYVVGGVGAHRVVGYGGNSYTTLTGSNNGYTNGAYPNAGNMATSFSNASTNFGWNAGGGLSFGWGISSLFVESRYFDVNSTDQLGEKTRFVPIILGLTFR